MYIALTVHIFILFYHYIHISHYITLADNIVIVSYRQPPWMAIF